MKTDFKKNYMDWLNENIEQAKVRDNLYRITFPYLDRNNDHTEIYIKEESDGSYTLTDDAETISELEFSGLDIFSSQKKKDILSTILCSHGISIDSEHCLYVNCDKQSLPSKKHMLTQCMIKVSDMFYLARPNIKSLFIEEVKDFFTQNEIYGIPNLSFSGKSGLLSTYDFAISPSHNSSERLIKIVNNLDVTKAGYITFLWGDTKEVRPAGSKLYVFIQDTNKAISQKAINAMKEYQIEPVLWSERKSYIRELTA